MSKYIDALRAKIGSLQEEKLTIDAKIEVLQDLIDDEQDVPVEDKPVIKPTRGRPKGSGKKAPRKKKASISAHAVEDELYEEATRNLSSLGEGATSPEEQERRIKSFNPIPKPVPRYGPGVRLDDQASTGRGAPAPSDATISVEDDE